MSSEELIVDTANPSGLASDWDVTVSDTAFYWYDLALDLPPIEDFRDPVGRYMRRMQFSLDATMEKPLMYFLVSRPRVRFDTKRPPSWGFFSSHKLTVPLLLGAEQKRASIVVDIKVPDDATLKKPTIQQTEHFLVLNWGGAIDTYSVHDLLQQHPAELPADTLVHYVARTRDPAARIAKGRMIAVNHICETNGRERDNFLLVLKLDIVRRGGPIVATDEAAQELLVKEQQEVLEALLFGYFERQPADARAERERTARKLRLRELQQTFHLNRLTIDLAFPKPDSFHNLYTQHVPVVPRHYFECQLKDGLSSYRNLLPTPGTPAK